MTDRTPVPRSVAYALGSLSLALAAVVIVLGSPTTTAKPESYAGNPFLPGTVPARMPPARAYQPVVAVGRALPSLEPGEPDRALRRKVGGLLAYGRNGQAVLLNNPELARPRPMLFVLVPTWSPDSQSAIDAARLVQGELGNDALDVQVIVTGVRPNLPGFPPAAWLDEIEGEGEVVFDDESETIASALGRSGFPFLVLVDETNRVGWRQVGPSSSAELTRVVAELPLSARLRSPVVDTG